MSRRRVAHNSPYRNAVASGLPMSDGYVNDVIVLDSEVHEMKAKLLAVLLSVIALTSITFSMDLRLDNMQKAIVGGDAAGSALVHAAVLHRWATASADVGRFESRGPVD